MKKKILVTGANGQLGKTIASIKNEFLEIDFIFTSSSQLNIANQKQVAAFFKENQIDWCINCAAYTAVDTAESEAEKANLVNVIGVKNLVNACALHGVKCIHISTDFVFNGLQTIPYQETDATNPQSVYGKTKLEGEQIITNHLESYFIIRTSWLYSVFGNNFVKTMIRLAKEKEKLQVVNNQIGSPTYALDLARFIMHIVQNNSTNYGLYHYSNQGEISWYTFAKSIFEMSNITIKLEPIKSVNYPTPAKRPAYSVLNTTKARNTFAIEIPFWKESLKQVIKSIHE
ncbi:MAG: dTDP-4-dehydrorhamnose reductase [Oceanihabitans sp.]